MNYLNLKSTVWSLSMWLVHLSVHQPIEYFNKPAQSDQQQLRKPLSSLRIHLSNCLALINGNGWQDGWFHMNPWMIFDNVANCVWFFVLRQVVYKNQPNECPNKLSLRVKKGESLRNAPSRHSYVFMHSYAITFLWSLTHSLWLN